MIGVGGGPGGVQEALTLTLSGRGPSRLGDGQMILGAVPQDSMRGSWSPRPRGMEEGAGASLVSPLSDQTPKGGERERQETEGRQKSQEFKGVDFRGHAAWLRSCPIYHF